MERGNMKAGIWANGTRLLNAVCVYWIDAEPRLRRDCLHFRGDPLIAENSLTESRAANGAEFLGATFALELQRLV